MTLSDSAPWCLLVVISSTGLSVARAAPCTPGTDCYCDKVKTPGSPVYDSSVLLCEDFEAPTLRLNQGAGNGPPYYGPQYDSTGSCPFGNVRGCNSYWAKRYPGAIPGHWVTGQPAAPTLGSITCTGGSCPGMKVWHPANLWDSNDYTPLIAFHSSATDFTAENATLTPPTNAAGGAAGVFDGNASLAFRVPAGNTHGILGETSWPVTTEVGLTQAIAYPTNATASGIWGTNAASASWKHNEWKTVTSPNCGFDGLFLFYNQAARNSWPFAGFIGAFGACSSGGGVTGGASGAYCKSVSAIVGTAACSSDAVAINWQASTSLYQQTRDFPEGSWGCVRGHMSGLGTSSARMRIWFTPTAGPNQGQELLILDFTYNDGSGSNLDNREGYVGLKWNAYANTNQGGGYTASTQTTFRYEDNVHIRAGLPVSCAQIGFMGAGSRPGRPLNLTVR